jgi:hypothetical protein
MKLKGQETLRTSQNEYIFEDGIYDQELKGQKHPKITKSVFFVSVST